MKKLVVIVLVLFFIFVIFCGVFWVRSMFFGFKLAGDFCLDASFKSMGRNMVSCSSGVLVVPNINAWIVEKNIIYGADESNKYFSVQFGSVKAKRFESMIDLNKYLSEVGLARYDMNREENISHLQFGGGRDRKYPE